MDNIILYNGKTHLETPIDNVLNLGIACVFALYCDSPKKVYVSHTSNLLVALGRITSDWDSPSYGGMKYDASNNNLVLKILTTNPEIVDEKRMAKLHTSLYAEEYIKNGYTLYKPTNLVKYNIRKSIKVWRLKAFYVVDLVNSRNDKILVGVFNTKRDMDKFLKEYYPNDIITGFYYANNHWTNTLRNLYTNDPVESER